jgi:hypothetical protein
MLLSMPRALKAAKTPTRKAKAPRAAVRKSKPKAASRVARTKPAPRADYGAPIDGFFAKQSPPLRAVLEELRALVEAAAPDATSALKWGMPCYMLNGHIVCALTAHRAHVNLVLSGPRSAFADPDGVLTGTGKTGRHLKLESLAELPRAKVRGWLKIAARLARAR